jgi:quercetin 2,3-dioxygenase
VIVHRPAGARGRVRTGWLDSRHTFSFGHYHDPEWMGFGPLRVINEDVVAPGAGFPPHRHANMEILSYVLSGGLAHRDSHGGEGVLRPGELQWMGAGHGIEHSEYNASAESPVHFLQVWIQPDRSNAEPAYAQCRFDPAARRGRWAPLATPDGDGGTIAIRQQARLSGALLEAGGRLAFEADPSRRYWLHVATGSAALAGTLLDAGSAVGLVDEGGTHEIAAQSASTELLLFDLPA